MYPELRLVSLCQGLHSLEKYLEINSEVKSA